jgi:hypothetical protein
VKLKTREIERTSGEGDREEERRKENNNKKE